MRSVWMSSGVRAAARISRGAVRVLFTGMQKSRPAAARDLLAAERKIMIELDFDVFMKVVALSLSFPWPQRAYHFDFGLRSYGQNTKVCAE